MNLENISREDWIVGGLALLLAICLLVLPWFDISLGPFGSATFSATGAPDGWLGILAFIACLAVVADLAIERLSPQTQIPIVNSRAHTRFLLAAAAAVFVVLKFLFHIHFSLFGWGFYVDIILTGALVYVALQVRNGAPIPGAGAGGSRLGGRAASEGGMSDAPPAGGSSAGAPPLGGPPAGAGTAPVGAPPVGGGVGAPPPGGSGAGGPTGPGGPPPTPGV